LDYTIMETNINMNNYEGIYSFAQDDWRNN